MTRAATPMMAQYRRIRAELPPDAILFFRLGDFYEMFYEDAVAAAPILDIALTRRQQAPMCGVPYHAAEGYIARLVRAGRKVAICDQVEDAAASRGIVRRAVTRVVTPGTILEEGALEAARSNYLAGVCRDGRVLGLAMLELSTGAFEIEEAVEPGRLADLFAQAAPAEIVAPREQMGDPALAAALGAGRAAVTPLDDWRFEREVAAERLARHFGAVSLDGFGCADATAGLGAAGAVLGYVTDDLRRAAGHVRALRVRRPDETLFLDEATVANLELVTARGVGGPTLLGVLDVTRTPMGGRLLRDWILRPLGRAGPIRERQDAVAALVADRDRREALRAELGDVRDLERLIARLAAGGGNPRDVRAVAHSLRAFPGIRRRVGDAPAAVLAQAAADIAPQPELLDAIDRALVDEPPPTVRDGGVMRAGFHAELDELRNASSAGRRWVAEFQAAEQARTGIRGLKVRHNRVFGYYIEVTKSQLDAVPAHYVRKQTLVNAERFITPELKEVENRILGAQDRALQLEAELFVALRDEVVGHTPALQCAAAALARLDALAALADRAEALDYVRPEIAEDDRIEIRAGRHPVIEQLPGAERFVPNDTRLDGGENQIVILTGPNMAGKSTYIRQVALIALMAHVGAFVPAESARIALTDRIFTRIGAGDDLARGRSTFMVEMQETANILNNATPRSLIVLDEIGRGTSTFDGISLAWAVAEHLHGTASVKARTLFATHYHELTDLALTLPGVKNYNVLVRERGDRVAFLRRIVPGAADQSYGIQVARLAGLPAPVIERAREILANLEEGEYVEPGRPRLARRRARRRPGDADGRQLALW